MAFARLLKVQSTESHAHTSHKPVCIAFGWPKITGQFNESLSAKPPPDVFWRVRSCILFQLDFPL